MQNATPRACQISLSSRAFPIVLAVVRIQISAILIIAVTPGRDENTVAWALGRQCDSRREEAARRMSRLNRSDESLIKRGAIILRKSRCVREGNKSLSDRAAHNTTARDNVFNALALASESAARLAFAGRTRLGIGDAFPDRSQKDS